MGVFLGTQTGGPISSSGLVIYKLIKLFAIASPAFPFPRISGEIMVNLLSN
jgi:hypothetical protein